MKLLMIADDFTGANDLALQLIKYGLNVKTSSKLDFQDNDTIISTETRNISELEASRKMREIYKNIFNNEFDKFYKKIDSTLRGNIKIETELLQEFLPPKSKISVVIPFPKNNRQVIYGKHYVNGIELHKSSFSKDPIKPIKSNDLKDFFHGICINLDLIRNGNLTKFLNETDETLLIFDGENDTDLEIIAKSLYESGWDKYIIGSSAIMDNLMEQWGYTKNPILFLSGSCNAKNIEQIDYLIKKEDLNILSYNPTSQIFEGNIDLKKDILIRSLSCYNEMKTNKLKPQEMKSIIAEKGLELIKKYKIKKIVSCGGDISIELMNVLKLENLEIIYEIEPGIALGRSQDFSLITKPGGFGTIEIYKKIYSFLKNYR